MDNYQSVFLEFACRLKKLSLVYAIKSPDLDLYDFGFSRPETAEMYLCSDEMCEYTIHAVCGIKVIWQDVTRRVDKYYGDTASEMFNAKTKKLIGSVVERVAISSKNDLWLDFGFCWVVFVTHEDEDESWRLFSVDENEGTLVASNSMIQFY